jgi:hypothetical protein
VGQSGEGGGDCAGVSAAGRLYKKLNKNKYLRYISRKELLSSSILRRDLVQRGIGFAHAIDKHCRNAAIEYLNGSI